MKRKSISLCLAKETLRTLADRRLSGALAGGTTPVGVCTCLGDSVCPCQLALLTG